MKMMDEESKKYGLHEVAINIHLNNGLSVPNHSHEFFELVYVVRGSAEHILNNEKRIISKGDYFIINYDSKHAYEAVGKENFEIINCLFKPEFIDSSLTKCRNFSEVVNNYMIKHSTSTINISPADDIFNDENKVVYTILKEMLNEYEEKKDGYYEILRCRLIEIIILTMRKNTAPKKVSDELCEYMINYVGEHMEDKNILSNISSSLNFSASYLSRKFKESMNLTFSKYLQKIRIEYCCRMLLNTNKKITEIAQLSGYSDIKYFNFIFKNHLGMTPGEFRKNYAN